MALFIRRHTTVVDVVLECSCQYLDSGDLWGDKLIGVYTKQGKDEESETMAWQMDGISVPDTMELGRCKENTGDDYSTGMNCCGTTTQL